MTKIDEDKLLKDSYTVKGVYHVDNELGYRGIKAVLLNGELCNGVICCDTNKGLGIKFKYDSDGRVVVKDGEIAFEDFFGKIEVVFNGMERQNPD